MEIRISFFLLLLAKLSFAQPGWKKADEILKNIKTVSISEKTYLITDFGALSDGKTPCKNAFDAAIKSCSEGGGGKIIVPAGDFYMNGL